MKCKQRLCQRTKNLSSEGNCNVCEDAIEEVKKSFEKKHKKKNNEHVVIDMKLMMEAQEKLSKGVPIDPKIVSRLLLSGIINIINQHDDLENLEAKVKSIEISNTTSQIRIESLEGWVLKQDERIRMLDEKVPSVNVSNEEDRDTNQLSDIMKKISTIETKLNKVQPALESDSNVTNCKLCDKTFSRNCELEIHIEKEHGNAKKHECNVCGKSFVLKWRMNKHVAGHTDAQKYCHYFNNNLDCPYEPIGCMFQHKYAGKCKNKTCTRHLCQFKHENVTVESQVNDGEVVDDDADEVVDDDDGELVDDDKCHLCGNMFLSQDALIEHMKTVHLDIFVQMAESNQFYVED